MKYLFMSLFILFYQFLSFDTQAQGIYGKHFLIEYKPILSYNVIRLKAKVSHGIKLKYAVSRNVSISLNGEYMTNNGNVLLKIEPGNFAKEETFDYYQQLLTIGGEIRHYIHLDKAASMGIAPTGAYMGLLFNNNKANFQILPNQTTHLGTYTYNYTTLGISLGDRTLLNKRISIDFGGNYMPVIVNKRKILASTGGYNKKILFTNTGYAVGNSFLMQAYIGISCLIF